MISLPGNGFPLRGGGDYAIPPPALQNRASRCNYQSTIGRSFAEDLTAHTSAHSMSFSIERSQAIVLSQQKNNLTFGNAHPVFAVVVFSGISEDK